MEMNTIFNIPSQDVYAQNYRQYIVAENANINPNIPDTDFWYKSIALSGVVVGGVADASYNYINIFPQYQAGTILSMSLANKGVPPINPATYATATLTTGPNIPPAGFALKQGMQLIDPVNNAVYQIREDYEVQPLAHNWNTIPSIATVLGAGNALTPATLLNFSVPVIDYAGNQINNLTVVSSVDGVNQETDEQANGRLLELTRIPRGGARTTDIKYILLPQVNIVYNNNILTDVVTIPNNQFLNGTYNYGVFGLSGTSINDAILNQGLLSSSTYLPFNRGVDSLEISRMSNVLAVASLINSTPFVGSVATQSLPTLQGGTITPYIKIKVSLLSGYSLSSILNIQSDIATISLTVEQLIQREVRRAICSQPFGALQTQSTSGQILTSNIPLSSIEQQLDYALGTSQYNGLYATILTDRQVFIYSSGSGASAVYTYANIALSVGIPNPPTTTTLRYIYDIADNAAIGYANINVEII